MRVDGSSDGSGVFCRRFLCARGGETRGLKLEIEWGARVLEVKRRIGNRRDRERVHSVIKRVEIVQSSCGINSQMKKLQ